MSDDTEPERRQFQRAIELRRWVEQPDLPDPTYDPHGGWKLDQFAMYFEPTLVRERKEYFRQFYNPELRPKRTVLVDYKHGREEIFVDDFDAMAWLQSELAGKIHKQLLEPGLKVTGVPPGELEPKPISRQLLEILRPVIETSELVERGLLTTNDARRYEQVRVFRSEAESIERKATPAKRPSGRPIKFTYFEVAAEIEREIERKKLPPIPSKAGLIRYFIPRLCLTSTGKIPRKPPSWRAVSDAIDNYGFMKFVAKD